MTGEEKRVYFHDSEHIWIDGRQYIGVTRVGQMVQEAKKEAKNNSEQAEKPPIGVMPGFVFYKQRIDDLTEAISRYNEHPRTRNIALIKRWAEEIASICDLMRTQEEGI